MKAMSPQPNAFQLSLPKAELHLHLEGAIDPTTLLELKRRHGTPSTLLDVEKLYRYDDFNGFLMAFKAVTGDLQTPEDYDLITYRLMQQLKNENILKFMFQSESAYGASRISPPYSKASSEDAKRASAPSESLYSGFSTQYANSVPAPREKSLNWRPTIEIGT
jgi:hypothetical protein